MVSDRASNYFVTGEDDIKHSKESTQNCENFIEFEAKFTKSLQIPTE
jgi:hypothetical protein